MKKISYEESKKIKLSRNFTLSEFLYSETAIRKNIDNSMPREYLPRIQYLVDTILQPLRDIFGPIKINSGYRSVELCLAIGSSSRSNHAYAFAADIDTYPNSKHTLLDLLTYIEKNFQYKELIAEFFPHGWVHIAAEEQNNKEVLKLKDSSNNYALVNIETIIEKYTA